MNLLAQVATENQALYSYGALGIICAWLMWRDEKRAKDLREADGERSTEMRSLAHRIDGLTKALLVDITERESCGLHTKRYAKEEIAKIDARSAK